jgi:hypothetical protein
MGPADKSPSEGNIATGSTRLPTVASNGEIDCGCAGTGYLSLET